MCDSSFANFYMLTKHPRITDIWNTVHNNCYFIKTVLSLIFLEVLQHSINFDYLPTEFYN